MPYAQWVWMVAGASLGLGILGDWLLRPYPGGVNLVVWFGLSLLSVAGAGRIRQERLSRNTLAWLCVAFLAVSLFLLREAPFLRLLNIATAGLALSFAIHCRNALLPARPTFLEYGLAACRSSASLALGLPILIWRDVSPTAPRAGTATVRGTLIAAPIALVFGALLFSADAVIEDLLHCLFTTAGVRSVAEHSFCIGALAWIAASLFKGILDAAPRVPEGIAADHDTIAARLGPLDVEPLTVDIARAIRRWRLSWVEVAIPMAVVNALFLVFVTVQVRYLFARAETVAGMTYSEYARRGFFELCAVAALVLPMQLLADWSLRNEPVPGRLTFRALAGIQLALLGVIMASAFVRMGCYVDAYGLTHLRLYSTAFLVWLLVAIAVLAATVLRNRRHQFLPAALVWTLSAVLFLNLANPDGLIATVNLARAHAGRSLDHGYLRGLSADAVPALVKGTVPGPELPQQTAASMVEIRDALQERWGSEAERSLRVWTWSASRARGAVASFSPCLPTSPPSESSEPCPK